MCKTPIAHIYIIPFEPLEYACAKEVRSVGKNQNQKNKNAMPPRSRHQVKRTSTNFYTRKAARPRSPATPAPESLEAAPLKTAAVVDGATTVPTEAAAEAVGVAVTPASEGAGVGVKVVVYGTALLVEKGPSFAVMVSLGVAV